MKKINIKILKFRGLHLCEVKEVRGVKEVIDVPKFH